VASESGDRDLVQCSVELPVSAPVESVMLLGLAGGDWDGGTSGEPCVGGFVAAPARV
jgi:hypothetical protein